MFVTRGMEGGYPKCLQMRTGVRGITLHVYVRTYLFFMFLSYGILWQQVTVSVGLFFTWVLCIYIILDKGCNILYVFGLNRTVCSHIVGVHLSSDQVTYYFMMDADFITVFYCVCVSKVSSNLQCVLVYDDIF